MKKMIAIVMLAGASLAAGCVTPVALAPRPRVEVNGVAPYRGAVWVPGHYVRAHREWVWVRGYWR
jgi:hypothetical protein